MTSDELKKRTKQFALRVIKMTNALPKTMAAEVLGKQLLRSATSVAANYRSACRGRSKAEFVAKLGIVEEESDESSLWLELVEDAEILPPKKLSALRKEANEITAIMVRSIRTARSR